MECWFTGKLYFKHGGSQNATLSGINATKAGCNESVSTATTGGARPTTTMAYSLRDSRILTTRLCSQNKSIACKTTESSSYTTPERRNYRWGHLRRHFCSFLSIFPCSSQPTGSRRTPVLSLLVLSSSVYLASSLLSVYLTRWFLKG